MRKFFIFLYTMICISVNYLGAKGAASAYFPLYLDSIMTISVVALFGLIPGIICAVSTNMLMVFFMGSSPLYTICHVTTAVIAWLSFMHFKNRNPDIQLSIDSFLGDGFFFPVSCRG